jgi:hypothetical protein
MPLLVEVSLKGLFDIGVYHFFDHAGSLLILGTNRTPSRLRQCLLVSKEK